ncbi:TonB-dependent receptor [Flavobacteriaceae bacterium F08102]|nr:TonB-dependent receptor [Flavobacteriaceae bacterium F08102]
MGLRRIYLIAFCGLWLSTSEAQDKYTLSGVITDAQNKEALIGVNLVIKELKTGTTTNENGFYSLTVPEGKYKITVSYLGFSTQQFEIKLIRDVHKNIALFESSEQLNEIVLVNQVEQLNLRKPQMSINALTAKTIKQTPVLLGEADLIKTITLLPGVTTAGEGASGFNVRGGAADQNLILLDEATVFNSSHLFGLFSVFNPDAIKNLKLFKGGIPARYGGRASSVLDIYQKEGNKEGFHVNGGIGIVSSRLLAEGPLKKEHGSFLLSGRSTYAHHFLPLFDIDNIAYFYDLNTKLSYKLNRNNNITLSGYFGRDVISIANSFENTYGNTLVNIRWKHHFTNQLSSSLSTIYSDYYYGLYLNFVGFKWSSGIQNFNLKYDLKHYLNDKLTLQYGFNSIYYRFNPGKVTPISKTTGINKLKLIDKYALENAIYVDTDQRINERINVSYGVRFSLFTRLGQDQLNIYDNNQAVVFNPELHLYEKGIPIGSENYSRSKALSNFENIEPRISLAYQVNNTSSIKVSYIRMSQYLHLLSNTSAPTPLDVWTPSGPFIKPQLSDQIAGGYFKELHNGKYTVEVETFFKKVQNRIDYIDGADLIANEAIEQVILNGKARAYGLEVLAKKNEGRFKGWFAYTLSKSEQQTPGRTIDEPGINDGTWYNTPYNKTHDISVTTSYDLNSKWQLNANFLLQSGQPTTYPTSQYAYNNLTIPNYGPRNKYKMPSYHRIDISTTFRPNPMKKTGIKGYWVFGIYNVYNRKNAASVNFRTDAKTGSNEAVRLSIFGIVPSVSYNFKF